MHLTERPVGLMRRAALWALVIGISLLGIKFLAYFLTGSAAIFSDAAESIVNVVTSAFAFYSINLSIKPADEGHPYGHRKIEFFSAALEGGAIIVAAAWIIYKAVGEIMSGGDVHQLGLGVWLVAFAAAVNAALGFYLLKTGKKHGSLILEADGKHILTDVYTSAGVAIGLTIVVFTGWMILDGIIAILVALNILYTGWLLLKNATGGMMDASDAEDKVLITEVLESPTFRDVCSYHKLRHRHSGNLHFVDFHLTFPKSLPIEQAHAIATAVEAQVALELGDASVMAHIEPCRDENCKNCRSRTSKVY